VKLVDLKPKWLMHHGERVGFSFQSPTDPKWRQSCFTIPSPTTEEQWEIFGEDVDHTQGCKLGIAWKIAGGIRVARFETLTVDPSIDGSKGGLWHGRIINGELK
jgi:hypothetical protein